MATATAALAAAASRSALAVLASARAGGGWLQADMVACPQDSRQRHMQQVIMGGQGAPQVRHSADAVCAVVVHVGWDGMLCQPQAPACTVSCQRRPCRPRSCRNAYSHVESSPLCTLPSCPTHANACRGYARVISMPGMRLLQVTSAPQTTATVTLAAVPGSAGQAARGPRYLSRMNKALHEAAAQSFACRWCWQALFRPGGGCTMHMAASTGEDDTAPFLLTHRASWRRRRQLWAGRREGWRPRQWLGGRRRGRRQ